jgi:hypothetical protein
MYSANERENNTFQTQYTVYSSGPNFIFFSGIKGDPKGVDIDALKMVSVIVPFTNLVQQE